LPGCFLLFLCSLRLILALLLRECAATFITETVDRYGVSQIISARH
jgi:hypothetical protein